MLNLTEAVKTAERCQRNWDHSKPVSEEDVKKIVEVATTMPTKQNRLFYELIVSTNPKFNRTCYEYSIDPNNEHFKDRKVHRNTQVDAPLLLMWRTTDQTKVEATDHFKDRYEKNFIMSIGISSGAAVLTANSLGYRTGYCQCFEIKDLFKKLENDFNLPQNNNAPFQEGLIVGIGNPNSNYNRVDCVIDDKHGYTAETINKKVNTIYVK